MSEGSALQVVTTSAVDCLSGGGAMGAMMRALDWSATPLGPVNAWPQSLRTAVSMLLESRFPMYIAWGAGYTQFYNDGYRPILGSTKHPAALGISTRETFKEIWHIIGPMFDGVMQGSAVGFEDFLLPLDRHGFVEECYFIFSYSPIRDESGRVGGVLVTVTETSERVLGARRLETLRTLSTQTAEAASAEQACAAAGQVLAGNGADLPFALVYLLDGEGRQAHLAASCGIAAGSVAAALTIDLAAADPPWPLATVAQSRAAVLIEDLTHLGPLPATAEQPAPKRALVLPIHQPGEARLAGILVAALFFELVLGLLLLEFPFRLVHRGLLVRARCGVTNPPQSVVGRTERCPGSRTCQDGAAPTGPPNRWACWRLEVPEKVPVWRAYR